MADAATFEIVAWWAGAGAAITLGGWAIVRIVDRPAPFGSSRGWDLPPVELPGFKPPGGDEEKWRSPKAGMGYALFGAFIAGAIGWSTATPDSLDPELGLYEKLFAVAVAVLVLIRTLRDIPAVGEAPPDDPDQTFSVRVRNAALKLCGAAFMLALVWLTLG